MEALRTFGADVRRGLVVCSTIAADILWFEADEPQIQEPAIRGAANPFNLSGRKKPGMEVAGRPNVGIIGG